MAGITMDVKKFDINSPEWFAFVEAHPDSTIFHHPAWAGLLADCYGYTPFVLVKLDEFGQIDGGIPFMDVNSWLTGHRWVSLPFSDHCMPLIRCHRALNTLMEFLSSEYNRKAIPRVEIHAPIHANNIFEDNSFVWHKLRLIDDPEAILQTFDRTRVRQPIRQAEERGVEVRWGTNKGDMQIFFNMLVNTRHRLGIPVQPKHFFEILWDRLIEKKLGFLLLAFKGNKAIAGSIFLIYKEMLTVKYNASLQEDWKLKANNCLYWTAIKWGCENKYNYLDFGRTEINNQKLRSFKSGWGTVEEPLIYSIIGDHHPKQNWKSSQLIKPIIYNSPAFICRAIGELFYKHFA